MNYTTIETELEHLPEHCTVKKRNNNAPHNISLTMLFFKVGELEKLAQVSGCLNHTRLIFLMNT